MFGQPRINPAFMGTVVDDDNRELDRLPNEAKFKKTTPPSRSGAYLKLASTRDASSLADLDGRGEKGPQGIAQPICSMHEQYEIHPSEETEKMQAGIKRGMHPGYYNWLLPLIWIMFIIVAAAFVWFMRSQSLQLSIDLASPT